MESRRTKQEIVKMLLKQDLEERDEQELLDLLVDNPISVDVDRLADENMTFGDKCADIVAEKAGSWRFIIGFVIFLAIWITLNGVILLKALDPFPFILLNLVLSCIAALQAPVIMMSQNRSAKKDTLRGKNDYRADLKSELILEELHHKMTDILATQRKILRMLDSNDDENKKE